MICSRSYKVMIIYKLTPKNVILFLKVSARLQVWNPEALSFGLLFFGVLFINGSILKAVIHTKPQLWSHTIRLNPAKVDMCT